MSGSDLRRRLSSGGRVCGTVLFRSTHPSMVEALPDRGLDFVMLHLEHNVLDMNEFIGLRYALQTKGIACLVRSHSHEPEDVSRICDNFPDGVVVPYVEDPGRLAELVAAAKHRPLRGEAARRSIDGEWPSDDSRSYIHRYCADTFFVAMIESPPALANLERICTVPGIDALLVGPQDLTVTLGIPDERDHPKFVAAVQQVIDAGARHGIPAGAHFIDLDRVDRLIAMGGRFIVYGNDLVLIRAGLDRFLSRAGVQT
ncbi:MAG: hypothetical protein CMJ18_13150 [Phycisphaeraceae bacterium]|nr:hypothetical protein [Phycisphaeraceae bacterium]